MNKPIESSVAAEPFRITEAKKRYSSDVLPAPVTGHGMDLVARSEAAVGPWFE